MIDHQEKLSIRKQCIVLNINRSSLFCKIRKPSNNFEIANHIHDIWHEMPFYGYRKITVELHLRGYPVNHKRIQHLMAEMGIKALHPKKRTTIINSAHKKYPYFLKDMKIDRPNHVWSTYITYIPYGSGFIYLVTLIDVFSRYILSWQLSNTMDVQFCMDILDAALEKHGKPEILKKMTDS